jgi:hypothetical protein
VMRNWFSTKVLELLLRNYMKTNFFAKWNTTAKLKFILFNLVSNNIFIDFN